MDKILVICGPTATGKTAFGIEMAKKFNGEIISADSRQVYIGRDLITGKDIPPSLKPQTSNLKWQDKYLKYYLIDGIKVWLYDIVDQGEDFSVSYWKQCADLVIADVISRGKLPIIVGGSGLFIKSLTGEMNLIEVPKNHKLRKKLNNLSSEDLFNYLKSQDPVKAISLNESDAKNPRRLVRAIEIAKNDLIPSTLISSPYTFLHICLSAPNKYLFDRIDARVQGRISAGAAIEDPDLASDPQKWMYHEHDLARRQITWFKKQPNLVWFDISDPNWKTLAKKHILSYLSP